MAPIKENGNSSNSTGKEKKEKKDQDYPDHYDTKSKKDSSAPQISTETSPDKNVTTSDKGKSVDENNKEFRNETASAGHSHEHNR